MSVETRGKSVPQITIGGISQVMAFKIAGMALSIISALIVPRMLGAAIYGKYSFLMSNMALFLGFTELGVTGISGRFISSYNVEGDSDKVQKLFVNLLTFKIFVGLIGALFFYVYVMITDPLGLSQAVIFLFSINFFTSTASGPLFGLVYGLNQLGKWASREVFDGGIKLALAIPFFLAFELEGVAAANLVSRLLVCGLGLHWCWGYIKPIQLDTKFVFPYLKFGLKLFLVNVFAYIFKNSGVILSGFLNLPTVDLGNWGLVSKLLNMVMMLCGALMVSLIPTLTQFIIDERHKRAAVLGRGVLSTLAITFTISQAAIMLLSEDLIYFMFGCEYGNVYPYLVVAFSGILPFALITWIQVLATATGKPLAILPPIAGMAVSSLLSSYVLIPNLSGMGTALSFSLSSWFAVTGLIWTLKVIEIECPWKDWITPALVGLAPLIGSWLLRGHWPINVGLFIIFLFTYGVLLRLVGYSIDDFVRLARGIRVGGIDGITQ